MNKIKYTLLILLILLQINKLICEWIPVHYEQFEGVESISCLDSNNCFAFVNHPAQDVEELGVMIYKSFDVGKTWVKIYKSSYFDKPKVIHLNDGIIPRLGHIFITSDDDPIIMKSIDSGKTFKKIMLQENANGTDKKLSAFAMYDTKYGFVANGYNYFTTKDGWETFERHPKLHVNQTYYSPIFLDSNTVVMTSFVTPPLDTHNHMAFMKYHMKENKWDTLFYFESEFKKWGDNVINLFFIDDSVGFGFGFGCGDGVDFDLPSGNYHDVIYKTTDRGYHWELIHKKYQYPEIGLTNNIAFADEKYGIAVGFYGKIAMTNDGGETWVYEPTPNKMDNARKMLVCWAGRTPLIGTWDTGIFRYEGDFFKFPVGVVDERDGNQLFKSLVTISPNPAIEYIEINVQARHAVPVRNEKIQIFNVYGICLINLTLDEEHTPNPSREGNGEGVRIDVSSLCSGVYFLRAGDFVSKFVKY